MNNINDFPNHYNGFCGIETRGNSTQGFDKKTYSIELWNSNNEDTSASLLGMGKEEDWILHAMVIDKSQVRIPFSFYLFQRITLHPKNRLLEPGSNLWNSRSEAKWLQIRETYYLE